MLQRDTRSRGLSCDGRYAGYRCTDTWRLNLLRLLPPSAGLFVCGYREQIASVHFFIGCVFGCLVPSHFCDQSVQTWRGNQIDLALPSLPLSVRTYSLYDALFSDISVRAGHATDAKHPIRGQKRWAVATSVMRVRDVSRRIVLFQL